MKMNIKKRLAVSNLLMLLIPVAVVLMAGLVFLVVIFSMLNSLMEKGVLKESGFVRSGKTYARTFEPAMSHAEYLAVLIAAQLPVNEYPALLQALLRNADVTPELQKELRAVLRETCH